jgi:hypothetical protein
VLEFGPESFAATMSDSGSPIFARESDGYRVAGIAHHITNEKGVSRFGDRTWYLRTDIHRQWIAEVVSFGPAM